MTREGLATRTHHKPVPTTTAASNCSWGGGLMDRDTTNDGYNDMDMKGMDGNTRGHDTGPMTGTTTWT
jgi:hypothetical protein